MNLRKKYRNYTIYLLIELVLVLVSLMFISSMFMDIFSKLTTNKKVMNLSNYINIIKDDIDINDKDIPYYKCIIFKDEKTGKSYDTVLISPKFLELKNFKINNDAKFTNLINENEALIGSNVDKNLGDTITINGFTKDIKVKVKGILDKDEVLWKHSDIIPSKLENSIIILDRETDSYSIPRIFSTNKKENFIQIKDYIFKEIFKKNSSIYISLIFIVALLGIIINSINLTLSIIMNRQKKVFGIKYSLGCTKKYLFNSILFEFYILSILAMIISTIISLSIQYFIPVELGYTFNFSSFLISIILYILLTFKILYKQNKNISKYMLSTLIKRGL